MFDLKSRSISGLLVSATVVLGLSIAWFLVVFGSSKHWNYVPRLTLNMQGAGSGEPVKNLAGMETFMN